MNTKERTREQISALADDELSDSQIELALAALRDPQARAHWDVYHQIGDALRSDDMAFAMSEGFSACMAARLEAEPAILAPAPQPVPQTAPQHAAQAVGGSAGLAGRIRRLTMPGITAAAVATAVFVTAPQMLVAKKDGAPGGAAVVMVASDPAPAPAMADAAVVVAAPAVAAAPAVIGEAIQAEARMVTLDQQQGEVLRDPRIDEYLMAHQRFSPSVYSSAQYARSATFASETSK